MSQSRNANPSWQELGPATAARKPPSAPLRSRFTRESGPRNGAAHANDLQPQGASYRVACRLFPGFAELPAAFRATLDGYAALFLPDTGPLSLHEREVIALAVTGRDQPGFGVARQAANDGEQPAGAPADAASPANDEQRDALIAAFAAKVTRRWLAIDGADVERLLDAGMSVHAIRAIAEIAAVFHFLAEISAAMLLRPRLSGVGRAPITAVASKDPTWRELSRWLA